MKNNILGTTDSLELYNKEGKMVYWFDTNYLDPNEWDETTYDKNGRILTINHSTGYSSKYTRDSEGKELTYENSDGDKTGFDLPEFTMEQLVFIVEYFKLIK